MMQLDGEGDGNVTNVTIGRGPRAIWIEVSWPEEGHVDKVLAAIHAAIAAGGLRLTFGGPVGFCVEAFRGRMMMSFDDEGDEP